MNDSTATDVLGIGVLILGFLLIIVAVMWIIFPVVTYYQLRGLDDTLRSLGRELRIITTLLTPHTKSELAPPPAPVPIVPVSCKCESCAAEVEYQPSQSGTACPCPNCGNEINLP